MQALVLDATQARVVEHEMPALAPDRALVRVAWAGICRTDLELCRGYLGFRGVLGHEFVGRVEEGPAEWRGVRVVGEINFACGRCETCSANLGRHCPQRTVMGIDRADGAIAQWVSVPVANLHCVPETVSDEQAVFTEPLAAAFEIVEQIPIEAGGRALVWGDGKLGLLIAQVLHASGAQVLLLGRHPAKLALLARCGIETALADAWSGAKAPLVIEATGTLEGFRRAVAATLPRGTLVLKSTLAAREPLDLAPLVIHEIQLVGSRCGPFPPALRALETARVSVEALVTARVPLARADDALRRAGERGALKILVDCS